MAIEFQVTFDCADPIALGTFWAHVLGYELDPESDADNAAVTDPDGRGPRIFLQRVPEPKTVKNRLHLDVRAARGATGEERTRRLEAEAERLIAHGATQSRRLEPDGVNDLCIVMQDPEGNEFCLD